MDVRIIRSVFASIAAVSIVAFSLFFAIERGPNAHYLSEPASAATPIPGSIAVTDICAAPTGATPGFVDVNFSTATMIQIIAAVSGRSIHICSFHLVTAGVTNVSIVEGTGTNCATGTVVISGPDALAANVVDNSPDDISAFTLGPNQALCLNSTQPVQVGGYLTYAY